MDADSLESSLRTSHRTVLGVLAGCAVVAGLAASNGSSPEPALDPTYTTAAVGLALGTVLMRRAATSPVVAPKTRVALYLCAYALAAGLGMLGSYVAIEDGALQTGLVYVLGAAIFCIRPPSLFGPAPRRGPAPPGGWNPPGNLPKS